MSLVDGVFYLPYYQKSIIKCILFLTLPIITLENRKSFFKEVLSFKKDGFLTGILLGLFVFIFLFGGYFIIRNFVDFSNIVPNLESNMGITKSNFIFVCLYIAFINSFLEEFFFRGFAFLQLQKYFSIKFAYIFSSFTFAIYHVAMMVNWVSTFILFLAIVGLFIAGVIFNYLNHKYNSLFPSWITHLMANLSINSVGIILFNI